MIDKEKLKALAEAFPSDLDWDSNTVPFSHHPDGSVIGGESDGTYTVYGKPFLIDGDDYEYDGPTYVERCGKDFAKFMVEARGAVLDLLSQNEALRKDSERYQWLIRRISKSQYYFLGAQLTSNTLEGVGAAVDAAMAKEVQP